MSCQHPHLKFEEGDNRIRCIDCPWEAKVAVPGAAHPMLTLDNTRHTKWQLPRSEPLAGK